MSPSNPTERSIESFYQVVNLVMAELEKDTEPDPRRIQINITGFLDKNAAPLTLELWNLLLSAQDNYQSGRKGIPSELIKEKMEEFARLNEVRIGIHEGILGSGFMKAYLRSIEF